MRLGPLSRRLLGDRFPSLARRYRSLFVDLEAVVASLPHLPPGTRVLDVGAGDGEGMNLLLERFPGVTATLIDLAPSLGSGLEPRFAERVRVLPGTSVAAYRALGQPPPDVILLFDVLHHVPPPERAAFLQDLRQLLGAHRARLVVKDLEPGHLRTTLGYLADVYVSGDKRVRMLGREELTALVRSVFGPVRVEETPLFRRDRPNYALVFEL